MTTDKTNLSDNQSNIFYSKIKTAFNKAALTYDENAVLQQEVGRRLLERLAYFSITPKNALDLGMGTGFITKLLAEHYPMANLYGLDFAYSMLRTAGNKNLSSTKNINLICGDINKLPFANKSIDLIFSNFSMHWGENIRKIFQECYRVLKNDGLLIFSIPGPNTLYELKDALSIIDPNHDHVNNFIDMHDLGDMLVQNKFAHPVMDNDHFILTYSKVINILKDLKSVGAQVKLSHNYRRGLLSKDKITQLTAAYDKFKQPDNKYPLTYEVIFGHAFKISKPVKVKHPELSEVTIPIEKIIIK